MAEEEREKAERKPASALLRNGRIQAETSGNPQIAALVSRGYGEVKSRGCVEFTPWEALHLVREGLLEVEEPSKGKLSFEELFERLSKADEALWSKYLVYRDLRGRGYMVKPGFGGGFHFRVYERGAYGKQPSRYLILTVCEGKPVRLAELRRALETAQKAKKEIVLAVIERRGEVVYYSLSSFR